MPVDEYADILQNLWESRAQFSNSLLGDVARNKFVKAIETARHYQNLAKNYEEKMIKRSRQTATLIDEVRRLRTENAQLQSRLEQMMERDRERERERERRRQRQRNNNNDTIIPTSVSIGIGAIQRHRLEMYRDMMQKVCGDVNSSLDPEYFRIVIRFFQLGDVSNLNRREICERINEKQIDSVSHCQNDTDVVTLEDISSIPYPFLISSDRFCFNILDLATDSNVSRRNFYTGLPFSPEFLNEVQQRLRDLEVLTQN